MIYICNVFEKHCNSEPSRDGRNWGAGGGGRPGKLRHRLMCSFPATPRVSSPHTIIPGCLLCGWSQCFRSSCWVVSLCCFSLSLSQCIYNHIRSNSSQTQRWSRVEANVFNPALTPYFLVLTHSSLGPNIGRTHTVYFLMASWKLKDPRLATREGRPGWRHAVCLHFLDCLPEETLVAEYDTLGWLAYNLIG